VTDGTQSWRSDARLQVVLDDRPVQGAPLRYRVTLGGVTPDEDTTDASGVSEYLWGIIREHQQGAGELFVCVVVGQECAEFRLLGVSFTP
jgi:hypothetical protein